MSVEIHQVVEAGAISTFAFNKDRTKVALSPNNNEIHVYSMNHNAWALEDTLVGHDQRITGLDWAPESNRIVSCAQDRNAYVWNLVDGKWKPTLVLLRINRAATCVKWSYQETKFAVGSGARLICICYFDEENDWWVAKHIKEGILSTILSLDWHPGGAVLAAGSADFKTYVFSCAIKGVDKKPAQTPWGPPEKLRSCGSLLQQYTQLSGGWVHGVAFSPSGNRLAWVGHASTFNVVDPTVDPTFVQTLKLSTLPLTTLIFTAEDTVVAGGHDCMPIMFKESSGEWRLDRKIDVPKDDNKKRTGHFAAMDRFRQLDSKATTEENTELPSVHQNSISDISRYDTSGDRVTRVATSGVDGKIVVWAV